MAYQLLVFDWDGTLMDSEARIVSCMRFAAAAVDLPVPTPEQARDIIGLGMQEASRRLFPDADAAALGRLVDRYRMHWLSDTLAEAELFAGAAEVVEQLSAQYLLAVATGKSRRGLQRAFEETRLAHCFQVSRCADETRSKPHPQMLEEVMEALGMEPSETLMIGDTEYDMQMAANAGVDALGVIYGVHERSRLTDAGALDCLTDIKELPAWLKSRI